MKGELLLGILGSILFLAFAGFFMHHFNSVNNNSLHTNQAADTSYNLNLNHQAAIQLDQKVIAQHNSVGDCWLIISGKVYRLTEYLSSHPGGRAIIIPFCGTDATSAFQTKLGEGTHSSLAYKDLVPLLIDSVNGITTTGSNINVQP